MKLSATHKAELTAILAGLQKARTPEVDECFDLYFPRPVTGMEGVDFVWVYYSSRPESRDEREERYRREAMIEMSVAADSAVREMRYERDRYYEGITVHESHTLRALRSL